MKLLKYIIPLWIGVFVYTVLSLCFGSQGFSAYSQLEAEKNREIMNITALEEINTDLAKIRDVLLKDRDNFHVHARELGFAAPGEHFVRIIGLGTPSKPQRFPGQVISPVKPDCIPDKGLIIF